GFLDLREVRRADQLLVLAVTVHELLGHSARIRAPATTGQQEIPTDTEPDDEHNHDERHQHHGPAALAGLRWIRPALLRCVWSPGLRRVGRRPVPGLHPLRRILLRPRRIRILSRPVHPRLRVPTERLRGPAGRLRRNSTGLITGTRLLRVRHLFRPAFFGPSPPPLEPSGPYPVTPLAAKRRIPLPGASPAGSTRRCQFWTYTGSTRTNRTLAARNGFC